jgi:hypothetical protein
VAYVSAAVEIVRKVAWAADLFAVSLARIRLGIAIAANNAMIATTIIISTKVKPFFILLSPSFPGKINY